QHFRTPEGGKREADRHGQQTKSFRIPAELDQVENGNGQRGGFTGNGSRHHDRGAKLAKGAGEPENHAGEHASPGERKGDGKENAQRSGAKSASDLFQARIDLFKRDAHGADEQREGHDREGEEDSSPGKDDF